jgi:hypothetical protein
MTPRCYRDEATVSITGRTGVEMEALTAVSVAALTIYDMCKAVDKTMVISDIRLLRKSGGKSGTFVRPSSPAKVHTRENLRISLLESEYGRTGFAAV